jgi:hypothetical protein
MHKLLIVSSVVFHKSVWQKHFHEVPPQGPLKLRDLVETLWKLGGN